VWACQHLSESAQSPGVPKVVANTIASSLQRAPALSRLLSETTRWVRKASLHGGGNGTVQRDVRVLGGRNGRSPSTRCSVCWICKRPSGEVDVLPVEAEEFPRQTEAEVDGVEDGSNGAVDLADGRSAS